MNYQLDSEQYAAAHHSSDAPAIVIAGPGSGKTRTLVGRHLFLAEQGVPASSILVATFTSKAAHEIGQRLSAAYVNEPSLPPLDSPKRLPIGTFHSICARLLKRFGEQVGLGSDFQILDTLGQARILADFGIPWSEEAETTLDSFGAWKDRLITPARALDMAGTASQVATAKLYAAYEKHLQENGLCDFARLIQLTNTLLDQSSGVMAFVRRQFLHVLIDEYQDTNQLQVEYINRILGDNGHLWVVGDDDQSLYAWRGADVRYSLHFTKIYKDAVRYTISQNYRSQPDVVQIANQSILNNTKRIRKTMSCVRDRASDQYVAVQGFSNEREEANAISSLIDSSVKAGIDPRTFAILCRTAGVSGSIQTALLSKALPFKLSGLRDMRQTDASRLFGAICALVFGLSSKSAAREVAKRGLKRRVDDFVEKSTDTSLRDLAPSISQIVGDACERNVDAEGTRQWMDAVEYCEREAIRLNDAEAFIEHMSDNNTSKKPELENAVTVSTIHAAKGLEWPHVFLCGLEEETLPHSKATSIPEERRLFYVGLTRACDRLILSYANYRSGQPQTPSRFLFEIYQTSIPHAVFPKWSNRPRAIPHFRVRD